MTKRIALLGHPVAHSISPAFQQAALDACAIDARYEGWDTRSEDLQISIERLRSGDLLGANVTVPHKVAAMRFVDRPDALAERVGALNTIVHRNGLLEATNTDVTGVLRALASAEVEVRGAEVLLVGAGGAARAVVVAMRQAGAARVVIANRTPERAAALASLGGGELDLRYAPLDANDATFRSAASRARVLVQSTSLGMRHGPDEDANPVPGDLMHPGQVAFDLVYVPEETPFLHAAAAAGARPVGGLAMLVHQGAEAFRLWTGVEPPLDVMFDAARAALEARSTGAGGGPEDGGA
ncbi:MAG: shikimate dehydrogenase [Dehalococcoidia bacterium]|nr:MAG: shikimate dehydrogenase [Dehalococcoidia bacterium]